MDKLEIPKVEKDKGRDCFSKGNYEEATKHFAKVWIEQKRIIVNIFV